MRGTLSKKLTTTTSLTKICKDKNSLTLDPSPANAGEGKRYPLIDLLLKPQAKPDDFRTLNDSIIFCLIV